jgi:hypothetical protein
MSMSKTALTGESMGNVGGEIVATSGPPPQIQVRSSLFSMEFWLSFLVTVGLGYAVMKGWLAPALADATKSDVLNIISSIINGQNVALLTILGVVMRFITSRGKTKSNAIWATASMNNPLVKNDNLIQNAGQLASAPLSQPIVITDHSATIAQLKADLGIVAQAASTALTSSMTATGGTSRVGGQP